MPRPTVPTSGATGIDPDKRLAEYNDVREIYKLEVNRLRSYSTWKSPNAAPTLLAKAGFFYTNEGDTVQCFICQVRINNWKISDNPITEHKLNSPGCIFVQGGDCGNVPLLVKDEKKATEDLKNLQRKAASVVLTKVTPIDESEKLLQTKLEALSKKYPNSIESEHLREMVRSLTTEHQGENVHREKTVAASKPNWPEDEDPLLSLTTNQMGSLLRSAPETHEHLSRDPELIPASPRQPPSARLESEPNFGTTIFSNPVIIGDASPYRDQTRDQTIVQIQTRIRTQQPFTEATERCASEDLIPLVITASSPEFALIKKRYDSFSGWAYSNKVKVKNLVEAGFYYTGADDRVRCFHCNGGLCNWQREDIPWYEHYRWFGKCPYLLKAAKNEVVMAIIRTAKHIHGGRAVVEQHHHHHGTGRTQCDIWQTDNIKRLLSMGFTRDKIQAVIDRRGAATVKDLDRMIDMLDKPSPRSRSTPASPAASRLHPPEVQRSNSEELISAHLCQICRQNKLGLMFLPCRHLVSCINCGIKVDQCPFCHKKVQATSKIQVK